MHFRLLWSKSDGKLDDCDHAPTWLTEGVCKSCSRLWLPECICTTKDTSTSACSRLLLWRLTKGTKCRSLLLLRLRERRTLAKGCAGTCTRGRLLLPKGSKCARSRLGRSGSKSASSSTPKYRTSRRLLGRGWCPEKTSCLCGRSSK